MMSDWLDVIAENALAAGEHVVLDVDGTAVVVFNIAGSFYALADSCSHDGGEIASGELDGDEIICPRHGARFCVRTGEVKSPPAYENIDCFALRIVQGRVQVRDNRWD
jgi:3-phenylpropionate/trans-cinnamate dioxygenase ferredoxin subunit